MNLGKLDEWARSHHGVVTKRRAIDLGWTEAAWYRAIRRGQLHLVHPEVARLHGTPNTPSQRIHAAVLAAGSTAVASHRSAAVLWGIERPEDDPIDVIVDRGVTGLASQASSSTDPATASTWRPSSGLAPLRRTCSAP